jgi:RNA polymerase sigma factor (TIGR02999 family)
LQTHALVHEAYLRLVDQRGVQWQNRAHFFGVAGQAMRRILVDHARRRKVAKRGGGAARIALHDCCELPLEQDDALIALDEALGDLAAADAELARIVEMRFFGGLSVDEVATLLGHSTATIHRRWRVARAWLYRALASPDSQETR